MADPIKFANLALELSKAESDAKAVSSDAKKLKEAARGLAVSAIKSAYREKLAPEDVRSILLKAGVPKGTVSKIVTVLSALQAKTISIAEVKSLSGAYELVRHAAAVASGAAALAAKSAAAKVIESPEDALAVIIASIKAVSGGDVDKTIELVGDWLSKITNGLTDFNRQVIADADEE